MFVTTLDQNDIVWLAFAAGIAAGSGNAAAHDSLSGILNRVQPYDEQTTGYVTAPEDDYEDDLHEADEEGFNPPIPPPPARPQTEFGPGPVSGVLR